MSSHCPLRRQPCVSKTKKPRTTGFTVSAGNKPIPARSLCKTQQSSITKPTPKTKLRILADVCLHWQIPVFLVFRQGGGTDPGQFSSLSAGLTLFRESPRHRDRAALFGLRGRPSPRLTRPYRASRRPLAPVWSPRNPGCSGVAPLRRWFADLPTPAGARP